MTLPAFKDIVAAAVTDHKAGRFTAAAAGYRAALALSPGHAALLHNLGVVAIAQGDRGAARAHFDEAVAADPRYALAQFSRALLLYELGDFRAATDGLERVCALEPDNYEAHRRLGLLWLAQGRADRALDHFARTYELRRGEGGAAVSVRSLTWSSRDKLVHDAAQFRFLAGTTAADARLAGLANAYEAVAGDFSAQPAALSAVQREMLGDDYNTALFIAEAPEIMDGAVTPRPDRTRLNQQLAADGVAWIDDFLTPRAHQELRRYLLRSTIWHDFTHIDGCVASYLEDGLACPLLLQIARECRVVFPAALAAQPLSQAWAFKGLRAASAVDGHTDDAAFSINFWVTPDEANRTPGGGRHDCLHGATTGRLADQRL